MAPPKALTKFIAKPLLLLTLFLCNIYLFNRFGLIQATTSCGELPTLVTSSGWVRFWAAQNNSVPWITSCGFPTNSTNYFNLDDMIDNYSGWCALLTLTSADFNQTYWFGSGLTPNDNHRVYGDRITIFYPTNRDFTIGMTVYAPFGDCGASSGSLRKHCVIQKTFSSGVNLNSVIDIGYFQDYGVVTTACGN